MKLFSKYFSGCCHSGSKVSAVGDEHHPKITQVSCEKVKTIIQSSTVIGEGGYSTVHLVTLADKMEAAVKVHEPSKRLYSMFQQELKVFLHLNNSHPNIVRLLGYGEDGESSGVLVMEHVPNSTLHRMLHDSHTKLTLSWSQRASIAYQIALALEHLHEHCSLQIIHGDVKASNVLLDQNLNPKLCDFGFARLGLSDTAVNRHNVMMGSPGYTDPNYFRSGLVSKGSDVYSFGVLLLELITGLEAFSPMDSQSLAAVMRPKLEQNSLDVEGVGKIIDVKLGNKYNEQEARVMVKIAEKCIGENPALRPSIGEVMETMRDKMPSSIRVVHTCLYNYKQ